MEYALLDGKWMMPMLGLGTWTLSGADGLATLALAIDMGYRLFDTAQLYGNEALVGKAVKNSCIPRKEFFLISKLCAESNSYQKAKAAIDASLSAMRTDYLDLMLIHGPYPQAPEMYAALETAQAEGKLRSIGISNFYSDDLCDFLCRHRPPAVDQVEAHIYCTRKTLMKALQAAGVHMQAWSPLTSRRGDIGRIPVLSALAKKYQRTPYQIALRYLVQNGISAIPRARNPAHLKENLEIFDFSLSLEDMRSLAGVDENRSFFRWNDAHESTAGI